MTADSNTFPLDTVCYQFVWLEMGVQGATQLRGITMKEKINFLLISSVSVLPASISEVYCLTTNIRCFRRYKVCRTEVQSENMQHQITYLWINSMIQRNSKDKGEKESRHTIDRQTEHHANRNSNCWHHREDIKHLRCQQANKWI
jgi:hypothetical protein